MDDGRVETRLNTSQNDTTLTGYNLYSTHRQNKSFSWNVGQSDFQKVRLH